VTVAVTTTSSGTRTSIAGTGISTNITSANTSSAGTRTSTAGTDIGTNITSADATGSPEFR
jgi:hypothetical protein